MSTPTNRQAEKEAKPPAKQSQPTPKGQASIPKRPPAASQPTRAPQRTPQGPNKPDQSSTRGVQQPAAKAATPTAPKAAIPPAPKPRDPSVARRDERREERRAVMLARQQEQRRELQRAKRQTLIIRYDLIIAPILLIGLVVFFVLTKHIPDAVISGVVVLVLAIALLAFAILMPTRNASRPARSETSEPRDGPTNDSNRPSEVEADDQDSSGNQG